MPAHKAAIVATSLVASNLRGVDSHGIQLLPFYIDQLLAGEMDPQADGHVVSESGSCLLFDGANGIGQWIAETCCGHAIRLATAARRGPGDARANPTISAPAPGGRRRCARPA